MIAVMSRFTGLRAPRHAHAQRRLRCVLCLAVYGLVVPAATAEPRCDQERSWAVHFRDATASDVLRVSVRGARCREAQLTIELATVEGTSLYRYQGPLRRHLENFFDADLASAVPKVVEDLHRSAFAKYSDVEQLRDLHYCTLDVPDDVYHRLKGEERPLFQHSTDHEVWQYVVFDARSRKGVVVFTCGV